MKIKELIFEDTENLDKERFSGTRNLQKHKEDLLSQEIPESSKKIDCLSGNGISSLESEADCLRELGVSSLEINYIITLRFREEEINKK